MATFIKAGFWEQLCKPCKGYKGWLNLDEFVNSRVVPGPQGPIGPQGPSGTVGLFAQTNNGPIVTNTSAELSIVGSGVGSLSVPANGFQVGDSFHAKLIGHITCNGSATIRIKIKSGSVILADTGVIAMNAATAKHWEINTYFTIRELGVAGVASIASGGIFSYTKNSGTNFEGTNFSIVNDSTFDTTILNNLNVTVQWGTATTADSIYSEIFTLSRTY
jgi:hypothetical protein